MDDESKVNKIRMKIVLVGKDSFYDDIPVSKDVYNYVKNRRSFTSDSKLEEKLTEEIQKVHPTLFYAHSLTFTP